jgi:hypothetical protein
MTEKTSKMGEDIVFFCKDCEKITDAHRVGKKLAFKCAICKSKNVAFGTTKSIQNYFHLSKEEDKKSK